MFVDESKNAYICMHAIGIAVNIFYLVKTNNSS